MDEKDRRPEDREPQKPTVVPESERKPIVQKTKYRKREVNVGLIITAVLLASVIIACVLVLDSRRRANKPVPEENGETTAAQSEAVPDRLSVTLTPDDVSKGDLILVNFDNAYVFGSEEPASVFDGKTASYKVNDKNVTLNPETINRFNVLMDEFYAQTECRDVMVVSGFRTKEFQRELYDRRVESEGAEAAAAYVALPGYSEHHTGLAMDLSVYTANGEGYYVRDYEPCKWLIDNFENYGFILRYPDDKAEITGINYESWHYRYVGLPHSLIMKKLSLCLEEYIGLLGTMGDGNCLTFDGTTAQVVPDGELTFADGCSVVRYYKAAKNGNTEIPVPEEFGYSVSGDNVGGFIITYYNAKVGG